MALDVSLSTIQLLCNGFGDLLRLKAACARRVPWEGPQRGTRWPNEVNNTQRRSDAKNGYLIIVGGYNIEHIGFGSLPLGARVPALSPNIEISKPDCSRWCSPTTIEYPMSISPFVFLPHPMWPPRGGGGGGDSAGPRTPTTPAPPPPRALSAQISATTKRGCRPWAGSPWGPRNRGADLLLPLPPPPQQKWGRTESRPSTPPPPPSMPSHPHCRPSHGDQGPSPHGQGADAERRVGWDLGPAW